MDNKNAQCCSNEKYYYNGMYTDLCGMSVEDYINATIFPCCNGNNNDEPGQDEPVVTSKTINVITFTTNSEGYLVAYTDKAPTTTIVVSCMCEGVNTTFTFLPNNNDIVVSEIKPNVNDIKLSNISIEPSEDEKYKYGDYNIVNKTNSMEIVSFIPNVNVNFTELNTISDISLDNLTKYVVDEDGVTLPYSFPMSSEFPENFDEMTDEEYEEWRLNNSYVPVIFLDKERFDNGKVDVYVGTNNMSQYFTEIDTKTIDGIVYSILVKTTTDANAQYLVYGDVWVNTFSADEETNIEYIVKENK